MAHSEKHQPDFNQEQDPQCRQKSHALSREIENLNSGIRVDFDQKLTELAELLSRFKALIVAPSKGAANDECGLDADASAEQISERDKIQVTRVTPERIKPEQIKPAGRIPDTDLPDSDTRTTQSVQPDTESTDTEKPPSSAAPATSSRYTAETARFETGLYKLNSQLYRFRLELDQELEFREEPLHAHFREQSELSQVLQKLNDKSIEKHSDN